MKDSCILLDTNFLIHLLDENARLHKNALGYYQYFLDNGNVLKCSTIAVAEYCVKGKIDDLPFRDLQILPFNLVHAVRAGELARITFDNKKTLEFSDRKIIPNDTKLFAQADIDPSVAYFSTSDRKCEDVFKLLKQRAKLKFDIINIDIPHTSVFGLLDF